MRTTPNDDDLLFCAQTWKFDALLKLFSRVLPRYGRWVTRRIAVATIAAIWMLAGFVSFVPISLSLHRPEQPLVFEDKDGKEFPTCALDLTPTYAVVSSCISFYVPCIVMIGIYCRWGTVHALLLQFLWSLSCKIDINEIDVLMDQNCI